jgi:hypothetical protein
VLIKHVTIDSPLMAADAVAQVATLVRPTGFRDWFGLPPSTTPFRGVVDDACFKLIPIVTGRNSFVPVIVGRVGSVSVGSQLKLTMRMHFLVTAFLLAALVAAVRAVASAAADGRIADVLAPCGLGLCGFILMCAIFYGETSKAERILREAVKAAAEQRDAADGPRFR